MGDQQFKFSDYFTWFVFAVVYVAFLVAMYVGAVPIPLKF